MRSLRSLLVRLALAAVGVVLLCALIYAALGWAVWSRQPWLVKRLGKATFDRWQHRFANAAAALAPGDADGDGVCDGLEFFYRTDPHNWAKHPELSIANSDGDGMAFVAQGELGIHLDQMLLVPFGEKLHAHCSLLIGHERHPFPRGFQIRIQPSAQAALALPGGSPVVAPLDVPVARDGEVCFDLQLLPPALRKPRLGETLQFTNVAGTEIYGTLRTRNVWPEQPLTPAIKAYPANGKFSRVHLTWPPVPASAEAILLEAARTGQNARWTPLFFFPGPETSAEVAQRTEGLFAPRIDALQFRVVPINFAPPEHPMDGTGADVQVSAE